MSNSKEKLNLFLSCRSALANYAALITKDRAKTEDVVQIVYRQSDG